MKKTLFRLITGGIGLSGFGVIVAGVLKKWHLIGNTVDAIWIIIPVLVLFVCREVANSYHMRKILKLSSNVENNLGIIVNILVLIISVLAVISIPFLWFGVIEELAKKGGL